MDDQESARIIRLVVPGKGIIPPDEHAYSAAGIGDASHGACPDTSAFTLGTENDGRHRENSQRRKHGKAARFVMVREPVEGHGCVVVAFDDDGAPGRQSAPDRLDRLDSRRDGGRNECCYDFECHFSDPFLGFFVGCSVVPIHQQ